MTALAERPAPPTDAIRDGVRLARRRRRTRTSVVLLGLGAVTVALSITSLALGDFPIAPSDLVAALLGRADGGTSFIVVDLRLPRLVLGLLVGVAFGVAGGMFQSVLRNPLASPDVIGISQGAGVGAVLALLVLDLSGPAVSGFALLGALTIGVVLYAVSWRGGLTGARFVLSGIGLAYMAVSVLGYLLTRADVREAQTVLTWLAGSVANAQWDQIALLALVLLVLLPLVGLVGPGLAVLGLGDELAGGLGVRVERTRLVAVTLGVCLAAVATAAAGPLAFVALTAAPIARRLLGDGTLGLTACALVGADIVVAADLVAQHFLPGSVQLPAGIVTGVIGGPYLIWLLSTARRSA